MFCPFSGFYRHQKSTHGTKKRPKTAVSGPCFFSVMTHVQFTGTLFRYRVSGLISRSPGQTAVPYAA